MTSRLWRSAGERPSLLRLRCALRCAPRSATAWQMDATRSIAVVTESSMRRLSSLVPQRCRGCLSRRPAPRRVRGFTALRWLAMSLHREGDAVPVVLSPVDPHASGMGPLAPPFLLAALLTGSPPSLSKEAGLQAQVRFIGPAMLRHRPPRAGSDQQSPRAPALREAAGGRPGHLHGGLALWAPVVPSHFRAGCPGKGPQDAHP